MAASYNLVILQGNIGSINELKEFDNGGKILSFTVATNRSFKRKNSQDWEQETTWHNIVVTIPALADGLSKRLSKGQSVFVEGTIRKRKYTTKDGVEKEIVEIQASRVMGNSSQEDKPSDADRATKQANKQSKQSWNTSDLDDDIPF